MSQVFVFQSHQVRTLTENSETWFCASDVCGCLGMRWQGKVLNGIPDDWQKLSRCLNFSARSMRFISEPAVYKLAFRSNKPEADAFTNWVASEVLPAIRKTGAYAAKPGKRARQAALPAAPDVNIDAATYNCGKRFFDDVNRLRCGAEGIREALHLFARPGGRNAFLSEEKRILYTNANEAANVAVTSLNQAIYALRMIYPTRRKASPFRAGI